MTEPSTRHWGESKNASRRTPVFRPAARTDMTPTGKRRWLENVFARLNERVVIVEGKRDRAALQEMGVRSPILLAVGPVERLVAKTVALKRPVAILTDFDGEGKRKEQVLNARLEGEGARVDSQARRLFRMVFGVRCVEDAPAALERLEEELEMKT